MKHYMDISRIKEIGETEFTETNVGCFVVGDMIQISEKVDGANASIALDEEGNLVAFSRKQQLDYNNNLRGFWNYVQELDKTKFQDLGKRVIFGEWLCSHTVKYNADAYNKWYVYDMWDTETEQWLPQSVVKEFAESHGLEYVHVLYEGEFISWDHCKSFLNSPAYGNDQEGIVIKNQTRINDPNTRQPFYLKIVNDSFSETKIKNHVKKVLDPQHQEEKNQAEEMAKQLITRERILKEINKMIDEGILPEKLQPKDMSVIAKNLPSRVYHDLIKEEIEFIAVGNRYFGKAVNAVVMNYAKQIVLGY